MEKRELWKIGFSDDGGPNWWGHGEGMRGEGF